MNKETLLNNIRRLAAGEAVEDEETVRFLEAHGCYYLLSRIPSYKGEMTLVVNGAAAKTRYKSCEGVFADLQNIPYAVIKGAVLSNEIYGSPKYRMSGDIDLLIAPEDADRVKAILTDHGFVQGRVENDTIVPYTRQELIYQRTFTHQTAAFVKPTGGKLCPFVNVDVNLDIFWGESKRKTDMRAFLAHTEPYKVCGTEIRKLRPVYEFISLCMHHYKDCNSLYLLADRGVKLSLFCDLYCYLTNVRPVSAELTEACEALGVGDYVAYCIHHTRLLFGGVDEYQMDADGAVYDRFGLTEEEYKYPGFGVSDMVLDEGLRARLTETFTEQDWKKIEVNRRFM